VNCEGAVVSVEIPHPHALLEREVKRFLGTWKIDPDRLNDCRTGLEAEVNVMFYLGSRWGIDIPPVTVLEDGSFIVEERNEDHGPRCHQNWLSPGSLPAWLHREDIQKLKGPVILNFLKKDFHLQNAITSSLKEAGFVDWEIW
jgi:hypothetical protein